MIVDDEPDIHHLTTLVLKNFTFDTRPVELIHGYSGNDARRLMREHSDVAMILLDVVMETDQEGLGVVRYIREELDNSFVRIILRTGQPGYAPESRVIADYDIDGYKDKVNLSDQELITSVTTGLRSYALLHTVDNTRKGLRKIIAATNQLYEPKSFGQLAAEILTQLSNLIGGNDYGNGEEPSVNSFVAAEKHGAIKIYAATGHYKTYIGKPLIEGTTSEVIDIVNRALREKRNLFTDHDFLGYCRTRNGMENLVYFRGTQRLREADRDLIETFTANITAAFEQVLLSREIIKTQKDVTFTLGDVIETRSGEAGQHVRRVAECSRRLAQLAGLSDQECEILRVASPMHDLGKIGIPDAVLNKPGKLTEEEWAVMQSHTRIGCQVLQDADQEILKTGSIVCGQHHEKWDGSGYPNGLSGEQIHIFARITALIDVFDALTHERSYKEAWSTDRALAWIKQERGRHFDPHLVDLFLAHIDQFMAIQLAFT
ncbi:MAG: DUF3369 domain-containing protein [Magnetococcales bacterium]|nr:DUF3369 domain-containing protein [Magnetococcales bacterium]